MMEYSPDFFLVGYSPLHYAAQNNNIKIVELLLASSADVDLNTCGATPLHRAAYTGSIECCQLLLAGKAFPNAIDTSFGDCQTPLHKAMARGHMAIAQLLLSYGADSTILDARGKLPTELLSEEPDGGSRSTVDPDMGDVDGIVAGEVGGTVTGGAGDTPAIPCSKCGRRGFAFSRVRSRLLCLACRYGSPRDVPGPPTLHHLGSPSK